ncbi:putative carboxymethylenebutenolidase [Mycobacterium ulcerans str. Harvey]|uniref:Carboxymethylenebutenolidase n=1 Tax=Mycobacterium ulcerans str. Harvey TaxID=1299332 RepID=A0ABN0QTS0_MYCUL|nr:putative carboxymethylenebutenolidase [Mycobacterium ulcerans str. Harvey]
MIMFPDAAGARDLRTDGGHIGRPRLRRAAADVYYREGDWTPFAMETVFGDADERARLMFMLGTLTPDRVTRDAAHTSTTWPLARR